MTNLTARRQQQAGFTLIELLIVVAILGLLAAIGIPQYQGYQAQARINATKAIQTSTYKYIGAELAKCTAGATELIGGTADCTDTAADIATAAAAYANSNNKNPYDASAGAVAVEVAAAVGTTPGVTYLVVGTPTANDIAITAAFTNLDSSAGTTPTNTVTKE